MPDARKKAEEALAKWDRMFHSTTLHSRGAWDCAQGKCVSALRLLLAEEPEAAVLPLEAPECNDGDDCCRYCGRGLQPCGACKPVASPPDVREAAEEGRVVVTATRRVGDKDTMSFDGTTFTTVRTCCDCGVLICGGPTRCLYCAAKLPTSAPGAECTGIAASWCPVHGNCSCPRDEEGARTENRSGVDCPLHGLASNHGDAEVSAFAARRGA